MSGNTTTEGNSSKEQGPNPLVVLVFSGKRKSGKDYITDRLQEKLGELSVIIRLSGPLKECYAKDHGLDYEAMLTASDYKEKYRLDMIRWSEQIRNEDYTYFCRAAIEKYQAKRFSIWIISDARRESDLRYFREQFGAKVVTVRIEATDEARAGRGWTFTAGIDDAETECGLDKIPAWDFTIANNGDKDFEDMVRDLLAKLDTLTNVS